MRGEKGPLNRPRRGEPLLIDPIKRIKDIKAIKALLLNQPRNLALFIIGINGNLKGKELLQLKISDMERLLPGDALKVESNGTIKNIPINDVIYNTIKNFLRSQKFEEKDIYLFKGQKKGSHISVSYLGALVKKWCKEVNVEGINFAAETLRKTWKYHAMKSFSL